MAVTRKGQSLIMTAASDLAGVNVIRCRQVRFIGNGLAPGDQLTIKEVSTTGAIVADHFISEANEDKVIWEASSTLGSFIRNPFLDVVPSSGVWEVLFQLS